MISPHFLILYSDDHIRNLAALQYVVGAGKTLTMDKEVWYMFLEIKWYWWLIIVALLVISIPFKIKFMRWWNKRQQEKKDNRRGKWGDDE